ncbi:hypothetical protein [Desulfatitalea alkaliphila]|uniref:MBG domain-containing protein n=1 Tax=Desulfatitalea alkaliphila TaxID=2929485 RepID=A0AA41R0N1_9BACT|nr:hypothetical protein [Desulfatitalea alkaliphila]MCJ8499386.1 hypothetical protein [Desulfatitalea alkaliphila]
MKRFTLIALAAMLIVTMAAGAALADSYNVTANFGIRVTEQGTSERVGAITLQGATAADLFEAGPPEQAIVGELLGGATISRTFAASYDYGGTLIEEWTPTAGDRYGDATLAADYYVVAIAGQDFFSIQINVDSVADETVVLGHDDASALCFNIAGTQYTASDPNRQLVLVSYADNLFNTYSGDIYVATVKARSIAFDLCGKALPYDIITVSGLGQGEDCGIGFGEECIFRFTDNASGALNGPYRFVIGKTTGAKAGVGFEAIYIEKLEAGSWVNINGLGVAATVTNRRNRLGEADLTMDPAETSEITVTSTLTGPGSYRIVAAYEYDTCVPITPGVWTIDIFANLIPCGSSFSAIDWDAMEFFDPAGTPMAAVFPYAAATAGGAWFNGLVFTNPLSTPVTIDVQIVEADGDMYIGQVTVPGNEMVVGTVADVVNPVLAPSHTDAEFGDESYAIYAGSESGAFYGFLFIGNGTMAQGYLPILTSGGHMLP